MYIILHTYMSTSESKSRRHPHQRPGPNPALPALQSKGSSRRLLATFRGLLAQTELLLALEHVEANFYDRLAEAPFHTG